MSYLIIKNVEIKGVSACVPSKTEENKDYPFFAENELDRMIPTIGVERRHVCEPGVTPSDMCYQAAEKLIESLNWEKDSIDLLIFNSPKRDYISPDTACILQDRLGLSNSVMAFDTNLGCTGWVYGISTIASILSVGTMRRALLLCGDIPSKNSSYYDKTEYPLFSDCGTATALEFNEGAADIVCELGTDGAGYEAIIQRDGGARHPFSVESLVMHEYGPGIKRTNLNSEMDGMSVFAFAMKRAPKSLKNLMDYMQAEVNDIDDFFFHQANLYMNKKIAKKAGINFESLPFSIYDYGNTSNASIPLTMVVTRREELSSAKRKNVGCGFGVGLSWASVYFETDHLVIPEIVYC